MLHIPRHIQINSYATINKNFIHVDLSIKGKSEFVPLYSLIDAKYGNRLIWPAFISGEYEVTYRAKALSNLTSIRNSYPIKLKENAHIYVISFLHLAVGKNIKIYINTAREEYKILLTAGVRREYIPYIKSAAYNGLEVDSKAITLFITKDIAKLKETNIRFYEDLSRAFDKVKDMDIEISSGLTQWELAEKLYERPDENYFDHAIEENIVSALEV